MWLWSYLSKYRSTFFSAMALSWPVLHIHVIAITVQLVWPTTPIQPCKVCGSKWIIYRKHKIYVFWKISKWSNFQSSNRLSLVVGISSSVALPYQKGNRDPLLEMEHMTCLQGMGYASKNSNGPKFSKLKLKLVKLVTSLKAFWSASNQFWWRFSKSDILIRF